MVVAYIIIGILVVHGLFLLSPIYRDETLEIYTMTPWTEKKYVMYKTFLNKKDAARFHLFVNWLVWPFIILFILVMPFVFLYKLPKLLNEYDGKITYSEDGKTLLKADENCRRIKVKKGTEVIASGAFDSIRVRHILLPNTIRCLKPNAFLRTHDLESLNLPNSIVEIDLYAFQFCGSLGKGLKKLVLPKNLHFLGKGAFYGCSKLERLTIRGDFNWNPSWMEDNPFYYTEKLSVIKNSNPNFIMKDGMLMSTDGKILFRCVNNATRITIPNGVEIIAQGAFCGRNTMEEVVFPNTLKKICGDAFRECNSLDNIVLPEGLESIGHESFSFCWNLSTVTFVESLEDIAPSAFDYCNNLKNLVFPKGKEKQFEQFFDLVKLTTKTSPF